MDATASKASVLVLEEPAKAAIPSRLAQKLKGPDRSQVTKEVLTSKQEAAALRRQAILQEVALNAADEAAKLEELKERVQEEKVEGLFAFHLANCCSQFCVQEENQRALEQRFARAEENRRKSLAKKVRLAACRIDPHWRCCGKVEVAGAHAEKAERVRERRATLTEQQRQQAEAEAEAEQAQQEQQAAPTD